jgi:DNA invertase Pin-like site-specific DNA recombinase/DNA-binding CsgD family transcriptional regulator
LTVLERKYDPAQPYRYAMYGRMSDPRQNKRSPEQQFATIEETIRRLGFPWRHVRTYRDDGVSGRFIRRRRGLQQMLRDIEAGLIVIDLIAVDTLERLGRAEEVSELRRKLFVEHGVLVVAADNNFADPTGVVGKAVGMVEQIRATEDSRIKAHNVRRGKKDAARLRRWPGGPAPVGLCLVPVAGATPAERFNTLEPCPEKAPSVQLAFARAEETGEGDTRMARWWNASPDVPAELKPISPTSMGYLLSNPIYIGELHWGVNRTGVVNDTRVVEPNPDGAEVIKGFCPPIITADVFARVQRQRAARAEKILAARRVAAGDGGEPKLITPQAPGLCLKYVLSGLVRCGCCGASMRAASSGIASKGGKRYVYYGCPRHLDGSCPNARTVPEDRLREAALGRLRARLFPPPVREGEAPGWLPELMALVRQELAADRAAEPDRAAAAERELWGLDDQRSGWLLSLANPQLPAAVRAEVEACLDRAQTRQQELRQALAARAALARRVEEVLDPAAAVGHLRRLGEVLAGHNPTLANLELSRHIEAIRCHPDGTVELRGTALGLFEGAVELLSRGGPAPGAPAVEGITPVVPRRRGRLRLPTLSAEGGGDVGDLDTSLDPARFAGLPAPFFWEETFLIDKVPSWAEANAAEVSRLRVEGVTMAELAARFGRTVPTIRAALRHARRQDPSLAARLPAKLPRRRWEEDHAAEVARLRAEGRSLKELSRHFRKSEPTIRKALRFEEEGEKTKGMDGSE